MEAIRLTGDISGIRVTKDMCRVNTKKNEITDIFASSKR